MSLLLIISVYWPAYSSDFVIASEDDPLRKAYSVQNGGWIMVAYCFATTQTAEGSVKKGLLRMAGTVTGVRFYCYALSLCTDVLTLRPIMFFIRLASLQAFSAWLALLACEDIRFQSEYNPYGLIAWMTVTSFIATYAATERGFGARIALSNSYGFFPIYFVVTQVRYIDLMPASILCLHN